ncbi:MAG: translocation/assembly module TamB domain-containing protein [Abditibacteriales bacterium]|nr:translocation/assembly module TamB domain-containing protein [Abditibacteriales bacterium]
MSGRIRSNWNGQGRSPADRLSEGEFKLTGDIGLPPALDDPPSDYRYNLALHVRDAIIAPPNLSPLSRISGDVLLVTDPADGREELTIHELRGYGLANQGTFRIHGSVKFDPLAWKSMLQYSRSPAPYAEMLTPLMSSDFRLDLDATNLRVLHRVWGGGTFNAHFTVRSVPSDPKDFLLHLWGFRPPTPPTRPPVPRVQGSVVISDGALRLPTSLVALSATTVLPEFPRLDVTMGIHGRVQVYNPILSASFAQGQLRVSGTPRTVSLHQVEDFIADSGRLRLPRADARIRQARIRVQGYTDSFLGTFEPRVTVDLTAEARVGGTHVTIGYGPAPLQLGAITSPEDPLRLTSDPPLPRSQIYTLLMGIAPEGVFGVSTAGRLGHAFSEQLFSIATAQATSYLSRALERATGLELFDIYVRESGGLRFNIQKQFGRFALGVRQGFGREGHLLFHVQYAPSQKWLIKWEQTEREQTLFKVGWRLGF